MESRPPRQLLVTSGEIEHHIADMTASFAADVTLADAQQTLGENHQWLPIDGDPSQTLGRLVEINSTGPLRLGYGAWRDLILGVQFVNGLDELITAGGQTVKNVAGYDLSKFMVGQRGMFGRIRTITTRTYRRPVGAVVAHFSADVRWVTQFLPTTLRPQWMMLSHGEMLCGYMGDEAALTFYEQTLHQRRACQVTRRSLDEDIEHRASLWRCEGELWMRASVPPARVTQFAEQAKLSNWVADAAFGIVLAWFKSQSEVDPAKDAAAAVGGSASIFRNQSPDFSTNAVERRMIERLKHAFDPNNRLAPLPWVMS